MNKRFLKTSILLAAVLFFSCRDPIFYNISNEVKPTEARIKGSPSNFVGFNNLMYVGSGGDLFKYSGNKSWSKEIQPKAGRIIQLASTSAFLYALCFEDNNRANLMRFDGADGADWEKISGGDIETYNRTAQFIFAANDKLFIGASTSNPSEDLNSFSVFYLDGDVTKDINITGELTGAAFDGTNYFLSTRKNGIYKTSDPSNSNDAIKIGETLEIAGMINLTPARIAVITRNANLYYVTAAGIEAADASFGSGRYSSGALAIFESGGGDKLLLAGRQDRLSVGTDSGFTYGYLEIRLDAAGEVIGGFAEPGINTPSTLVDGDNARYRSTIGINPVNSIFQAEDGFLFAATQVNGVWSYRDRSSGGWQWNAEE